MTPDDLLQQIDLADLLTGTAKAIVQAQSALDSKASEQADRFIDAPDGTLAIPPLWFTIRDATVEIEMSAAVAENTMQCRLLNPNQVALFGYHASSGLRARMTVAPNGVAEIKTNGGAK